MNICQLTTPCGYGFSKPNTHKIPSEDPRLLRDALPGHMIINGEINHNHNDRCSFSLVFLFQECSASQRLNSVNICRRQLPTPYIAIYIVYLSPVVSIASALSIVHNTVNHIEYFVVRYFWIASLAYAKIKHAKIYAHLTVMQYRVVCPKIWTQNIHDLP